MFTEMRQLPSEQLDAMVAGFGPWVAERLERGDYHGWFGANILNVYVQPNYRRRGLARALTETALDWCRQNGVRMVILHASDAGRPIYEALGFKATNEMSLLLDPGRQSGRPAGRA